MKPHYDPVCMLLETPFSRWKEDDKRQLLKTLICSTMSKKVIERPKYIAAGFDEDAVTIIEEFVEENTTEFSEFARIWRKYNFSLVFMGRPDHIELTEFTNEIFKITSDFLPSASFYKKVGAIYLLYALFRNQISVPTIKIRLEIHQWRIIKTVLLEAKFKGYRSLHYVIEFLIEHAFIFVTHQMLKGPLTSTQAPSKYAEILTSLKVNYKTDAMDFNESRTLETLVELHGKYLEEKKKIMGDVNVSLHDPRATYKGFINELKCLVEPGYSKERVETVAEKRAKIKAKSYTTVIQDRFGNTCQEGGSGSESGEAEEKDTKVKMRPRKPRVAQQERKVGRPALKPKPKPAESESTSDDEVVDISHLLPQQQDYYLPPIEEAKLKKLRTRREHYYKTSPKHEESSDPEANL